MSAGLTAFVLSTIAIGVASSHWVVPLVGWQASLMVIVFVVVGG